MMIVRRALLALILLTAAASVHAQDVAPVKVRFLRSVKGSGPLPPLVHLGIELENTSTEPRWLLLSLSREIRLPKDGKFTADPEGGMPFFVLEAKDDKNGRAAMVGFLGEPRFTAFYLPAGAKVVLEDFEFPSVDDLSEIDWLEAKSLLIDGKTPLEKWLPVPLQSLGGTKLDKDAAWIDALRDAKSGEPRGDLPKDKVSAVTADVVRAGRLQIEGFQAPARFYQPEKAAASELPPGWTLQASFQPVRPLKVEQVAFSPDSSWLAVSLQTFKVIGLDLEKLRERTFPLGDKTLARFFAFSPEGNLLVKQASQPNDPDGNLDLADWTAGKVLDVLRFSSRGSLGNLDHVASPDGQRVAVLQRTSMNLWDFAKLDTVGRFAFPESTNGFVYRTGVFSPDGKRFAAGLENPVAGGKAIVWDVESGKVIAEFTNKQSGLHFLTFSADGGLLAGTGKQSPGVWVWSVGDKDERIALRDIPFSSIHALALSPDGSTLALAAEPFAPGEANRGVELFDVARKEKIGTLTGLRSTVTALAFSRDGRRLAAGDQLGNLRVWQRKSS